MLPRAASGSRRCKSRSAAAPRYSPPRGRRQSATCCAGLGVAHVMDSRSLAFADEIMAATGGRGVDVVLNSLCRRFHSRRPAQPRPRRTLSRTGQAGHLVRRCGRGDPARRPLSVYDLGALAQADHALLPPLYDEILAGLADGSLRPAAGERLPAGAGRRSACATWHQARHIGQGRPARRDRYRPGAPLLRSRRRRPTGSPVAWARWEWKPRDWLVQAGARHLVLSSRRPPGEAAQRRIAELESSGATRARLCRPTPRMRTAWRRSARK